MEKVKIGQITSPVGIRGEVRVFPYTDRSSRFSDIKNLFIEDMPVTVASVRDDKNLLVIRFNEIKDRNSSETLRNKYIYANAKDYKLEKDSYFTEDLIGCLVFSEDGEKLGVLDSVTFGSAQDIYSVKKEDESVFMVPAVKEFIKNVDIDNKKITIHLIEGLI